MLEIRDRNGVVSVAEAIEGSLDDRSYGQGSLEGLQDDVSAMKRTMGELVSKLHDKGSLSDADIVDMLNWRYSASEVVS